MLACALAYETGMTFLRINVSILVSKWVGDSVKMVHVLDEVVSQLNFYYNTFSSIFYICRVTSVDPLVQGRQCWLVHWPTKQGLMSPSL